MKQLIFALFFFAAQVAFSQVSTADILSGQVRIQTRVKQGTAEMIPADTLRKVIRIEAATLGSGGATGIKLLQSADFDINGNYTPISSDKLIIISEGGPIAFLTPSDNNFYIYAIEFIAPSEGFSDPVILGNPSGILNTDKFELLPTHKAYVQIRRNSSGVYVNMVINIQ